MSNIHLYDVNLEWNHGRMGTLTSDDLHDQIEVATPPEFAKGVPGIWTPEHLFVAAVNSCLMTTFLAIAENSNLEFDAFSCSATGKLERVNGKFAISEIILKPVVKVLSEKEIQRAEKILLKSEEECFISNSAKSKIILQPAIIISEAVN